MQFEVYVEPDDFPMKVLSNLRVYLNYAKDYFITYILLRGLLHRLEFEFSEP